MRIWLFILLALLQTGCSKDTTSPTETEKEPQPNIIWLVAEDLSVPQH
jgi:PBP1b-binding outer membrane lipoprotein LpoB